jgi:hypothetical protein
MHMEVLNLIAILLCGETEDRTQGPWVHGRRTSTPLHDPLTGRRESGKGVDA